MGIIWSKEEIEALKKVYPLYLSRMAEKSEILKLFKGRRTWSSILKKASDLGIAKKVPQPIDLNVLRILTQRGEI